MRSNARWTNSAVLQSALRSQAVATVAKAGRGLI